MRRSTFTCVPDLKYAGEFGVCSNMERLIALLSIAVLFRIASAIKHPCLLVLSTPLSRIEVPPDAEL